jgi:hypothetical protein
MLLQWWHALAVIVDPDSEKMLQAAAVCGNYRDVIDNTVARY